MQILVIGSLNIDLVTKVSQVPKAGETVPAYGFSTHCGGKGANQAYALRRLIAPEKADVLMAGCVGNDSFGKELLKNLSDAGVDTSQVSVLNDERTGVATILVETDGENRIMVYPGANGEVTDASKYITDSTDYIVLQNEIPLETTFEVLRAAKITKTRTILNPSPLPKVNLSEFPYVDVLVVNEGEAEELTGLPASSVETAKTAIDRLLEVSQLSVITLGASGVVWKEKGGDAGFQPAHKATRVVDTTGAGDTFLAALVSQLLEKSKKMEEKIAFAAKAAAIAVSREGAASSIPDFKEVTESS